MATFDYALARNPPERRQWVPERAHRVLKWWRITARVVITFVFLMCGFYSRARSDGDPPEVLTLTRKGHDWVEETLRGLSLEDKVGQMLLVRCYADYGSFEASDYKILQNGLQKDHIGSVILSEHLNAQGLVRVDPVALARVANQLQSDSQLPLLVAADLERGVASRLKDVPDFPWPMAFGAVGDLTESSALVQLRLDQHGLSVFSGRWHRWRT